MYEARRWTLELSVQAPVWRDIARRAATESILVCGLRFVFGAAAASASAEAMARV